MNKKLPSIIELADKFKDFEVKFDLFNQQLSDGTYYWDVIRYRLYMLILTKNGIYEHVAQNLIPKQSPLWKRIVKTLYLAPFVIGNRKETKLKAAAKAKYAFQITSRFQLKDGTPEDLLMQDLTTTLRPDTMEFEIFRGAFKGKPEAKKNRYFLYQLEWNHLFPPRAREDWSYVNKAVEEAFGINPDCDAFLDQMISQFRCDYRFFKKFFAKIKPAYLIFQLDPKGMIAAANELGIITIDQLHGHSNNVDMAFSYPKGLNLAHVPSIPKILFTLGEFWNRIIDFPNKIVNVGNNYFYIEQDPNAYKQQGIMIVSTKFAHLYLSQATANLAKSHPDITFYYKLHSNQDEQLQQTMTFFKDIKNVEVVFTEKSVKELMEKCFAIALIQSSVAYQAVQKGLRAFIFKADFYEASYDIFNEPAVYLVDDWQHFSSLLTENQYHEPAGQQSVFFEPFNEAALKAALP